MPEKIYSYQQLFNFTTQVFKHIGCSTEQAELAAEVLISADLRGIDSHGVARLSGYVRLWEAKRVNANPVIRIIHETPTTAVVDGDSEKSRHRLGKRTKQ
jgi:LDH2 family malate/lactate/ureidoglycolate dehydrogenase